MTYLSFLYIDDNGNGLINGEPGLSFDLPRQWDADNMERALMQACIDNDIDYTEETVRKALNEAVRNYDARRDPRQLKKQIKAQSKEPVKKQNYDSELNVMEERGDADIMLQLIKDDKIEAFRSGVNDQVYIIAPKPYTAGKQQLAIPSGDFDTYARAIFARDYERIRPMVVSSERIAVLKRRIDSTSDDALLATLKDSYKTLWEQFKAQGKKYEETYGHRPSLHYEVVGESALNNVAEQLKTFALSKRELHLRAFMKDGAIYYDCQTDDYEYIVIKKEGYSKLNDSYNYFRRGNRQGANDLPQDCNLEEAKTIFDNLFGDFNFIGYDGKEGSIEQKTLAKVFTLWLIYNDHKTMRPIEPINASPNSGKTTFAKIQKLIVDPSKSLGSLVKVWVSNKKDAGRDRFVAASKEYFFVLDNVKRVTSEDQDDLCVMATGGSLPSRKLYTDDEMHQLEVQTNVCYTAVSDIATYSDLIRRQIPFKLAAGKIDINENMLFDYLLANRPKILHFVFSTLTKALALLEKMNFADYTHHRGLWQFVMVGDVIAEAMGEGERFVSKLFETMPLLQAQRAIENDAFATAFVRWAINSQDRHMELSSGEIKTQVEDACRASADYTAMNDYSWPDSAKAVSSKLEYLTPTLKELGLWLSRGKIIHGYRPWIIEKKLDDESTSMISGPGNGSDGSKKEDGMNSMGLKSDTAIQEDAKRPVMVVAKDERETNIVQAFSCPYCDHQSNSYELAERHSVKNHPDRTFAADFDAKNKPAGQTKI